MKQEHEIVTWGQVVVAQVLAVLVALAALLIQERHGLLVRLLSKLQQGAP